MAKLLEVIVTSVEEALEAAAGGADRLEVVRALEVGGLTPEIDLVEKILGAVTVPVRIMLRENASMSVGSAFEMRSLKSDAQTLSTLPIDGLVAGFVNGRAPDIPALLELLSCAPGCRVTFHRAFDELPDSFAAITALKQLGQIDRILTTGGQGNWMERRRRLIDCHYAAGPSIQILTGAGLCSSVLANLAQISELREVHVGRAARVPQTVSGAVRREAVRSLKSVLQ
jgi:copper homeostasis protein